MSRRPRHLAAQPKSTSQRRIRQRAGPFWRLERIDAEKMAIKAALDLVEDPASRLRAALRGVGELDGAVDADGSLKRYLYIMSALVHHVRHGGLTLPQVNNLAALGTALLSVQGILPGRSNAASLHSDLHMVLSQAYRKAGQPFRAAWQQHLSQLVTKASPSSGKGLWHMTTANRLLRLGHAPLAERGYVAAEAAGLTAAMLQRARLERTRALRLSGRHAEAAALAEETCRDLALSPPVRAELEWEAHCREASTTGVLDGLRQATGKGRVHAEASYVLEASLWVKVPRDDRWQERFPLVSTLSRSGRLDGRAGGFPYRCARVLDECYDDVIPMTARVAALGQILERGASHLNVDRELLVLAAAARWLARKQVFSVASLVLAEYRALSWRLSDGANPDVLGLLADLLARPWFK